MFFGGFLYGHGITFEEKLEAARVSFWLSYTLEVFSFHIVSLGLFTVGLAFCTQMLIIRAISECFFPIVRWRLNLMFLMIKCVMSAMGCAAMVNSHLSFAQI